MKKFTEVLCLILTGVILGYAWAAISYLPHIAALQTANETYRAYINKGDQP